MIINELRAIQHRFGYIPEKELQQLSARIRVPVYELYGVASFYPHFRLQPPPPVEIHICADMPCHLHGCDQLRRQVNQMVRDQHAEGVVVRPVSCLGQCDGAPAFAVNDHIYARKSIDEALELAGAAIRGNLPEPQKFPPLNRRFLTDPYADERERYGAVKTLISSRDLTGTIEKLKAANLKGMGGAGFPAGLKWELVRNASAGEKYVICNADESEVGTFKDREIMKNLPYLLIEGMIAAGVVTGAQRGIIYIRHEYEEQIEILQQEIARARGDGLIGKNLLGSGMNFDLEVFVSPGGYIQGEESALLEAIEGRRGQPRNKPPFPVTNGLWNKPTVINNVETLCYVPVILIKGAEWFKAQGAPDFTGLKWVAVSGHVNNPGVFEIPMGTPASRVIFELAGGISGGRKMKAFAPSGPSSGFLPASMADIPLDFKTLAQAGAMLGSGAIVAIAEGTCMIDLALNEVRFYRNESCGKCVPCRVGSQKMVDIIYGITHGSGTKEDLETIHRLADTLLMTSICGLGQVVANPITSVIKHFPQEVEEHMVRRTCPSGTCFKAEGSLQ